MRKLKQFVQSKLFWLKTGYRLEIANEGKPVNPVVIRFREYYIEVLLDAESGEPTGFGWSTDPGMSHVPVREHYIAASQSERRV